jgi:spore germination protein GerM
MNRTPALIGVLLVIVVVLAALLYRSALSPKQNTSAPPPSMAVPSGSGGSDQTSSENSPVGRRSKVEIYTVSPSGSGADDGLVPQTISLKPGASQSPARAALNALIRSKNSPLPPGTHLRGIKIDDGLATVDLSREFQQNFHGGDTAESQTINSILTTLGQFPNIDRVQILVEGKPIEALSQLPISAPLDVIRLDTGGQAQNAGDSDNN